ncbi:MAG: LolA-related protein [Rhodanobacteraceae bacterium]
MLAASVVIAVAAVAAEPGLAQSLLAKLARTPPVSTPFIEVSYRGGVLTRPLVVEGTLRWFGDDRLERVVTKPFTETAKAGNGELSVQRGDGEVHRVRLARAPQVGALLAGFRALLGGNLATLEKDFTLAAEGGDARWVVTLTPRTATLRQQLASIAIDGRGREPRCLTVTDANGDGSITLLGTMARAGLQSVAPLQSALAARCRNP